MQNDKKNTNLKAYDVEVMVMGRRFIRSIWDEYQKKENWKYTNTITKIRNTKKCYNKKKTDLKADDEEVMVISRRFIRSIWEAAAILLAVIIAPLRELFHSLNFNHHPTLTSSSSRSSSLSRSSSSSSNSYFTVFILIIKIISSTSSSSNYSWQLALYSIVFACVHICFLLCAASFSCERQICTMNREIFVTLVTRYKWPALEKRNILPSVKALWASMKKN